MQIFALPEINIFWWTVFRSNTQKRAKTYWKHRIDWKVHNYAYCCLLDLNEVLPIQQALSFVTTGFSVHTNLNLIVVLPTDEELFVQIHVPCVKRQLLICWQISPDHSQPLWSTGWGLIANILTHATGDAGFPVSNSRCCTWP